MEEVKQRYLRSGMMGRVGFGQNPCLLVIDLNRGFTDPSFATGVELTEVLQQTKELLDVARRKGVKIIFTSLAYRNKEEIGLWLKKLPALEHLIIGTGAEEIDPLLEVQEDESMIIKRFGSAFYGTPLIHELNREGIDTLILTGMATSGCIRATAIDGLQNGYRVIVPREAVGDRAEETHKINLFDIDAKYGDVLSVWEVKEYLESVHRR